MLLAVWRHAVAVAAREEEEGGGGGGCSGGCGGGCGGGSEDLHYLNKREQKLSQSLQTTRPSPLYRYPNCQFLNSR